MLSCIHQMLNEHTHSVSVTETNLDLLAHSKVNLLTPGCGEGKYSVYCRVPNKENAWLMLKIPKLSDNFEGRSFKGSMRKGASGRMISMCTILRLVGIKVKFQASSTL